MNRKQFKQRLDFLRDELAHAMIAYQIYTNILTDNPERLDATNNLHVFFTAAAQGCRDTVYLALAKIFEKNSESINIWKLLNAAKQHPRDMELSLTNQDFQEINAKLASCQSAIDRIKRVRNKRIAHIEDTDVLSPTFGELEGALQAAEYVLEKLYYTCFAEENLYAGVKSDAVDQAKTVIDLVVAYKASPSRE